MVVGSERTDISLVTVDDRMAECSETIQLLYVTQHPSLISFLLNLGEFVRTSTIVKIVDNDCE